jgi:predicted amidophosphoribosyltransferase
MPRLIRDKVCPHCRHELTEPRPRVCPSCGGSLQQRYLRAGCLSSAPPLVALALGLRWLLEQLAGR